MSERQAAPYDSIARRWLALVERRQEHFIELCDTGRWRHYYTKAEFLEEMRKVLRVRDQWAIIAGLPAKDEDPNQDYFSRYRPKEPSGLPTSPPAAHWPD